MKKMLWTISLIISSCQSNKDYSNDVKIAAFENIFTDNQIKDIETKYNIKISLLKLQQEDDFIRKIKKEKASLVIAPIYLNQKLLQHKLLVEINKNVDFEKSISQSTNTLKNKILPADVQNKFMPLFLSDFKVFSNNKKFATVDSVSLKNIFDDKHINITLEKDPRLISWISSYINSKDLLKSSLIANPTKEDLNKYLKDILKRKNVIFKSRKEILSSWKNIDVFIGQNWIQNHLPSKTIYKKSFKINNANLIQLTSLSKTVYSKENADRVIEWIAQNYSNTTFSYTFNPVTDKDAQQQYYTINNKFRQDMILSPEGNYYYFTNDEYDNNYIWNIIK